MYPKSCLLVLGVSNFVEFIKNVFNIRGGGLAIYVGIICGILGIVLVTHKKKINTLKLMDMAGPGVMIAQAMGRWGNFFNKEAFGCETTLPWKMGLYEHGQLIYVHPTFLYESVACFLLVIIMLILWKFR